MKLCRFDKDRLGIVQGDVVLDVSKALAVIPQQGWPIAQAIRSFSTSGACSPRRGSSRPRRREAPFQGEAPFARGHPSKIIGAPINYDDHIAESVKDPGIAHGRTQSSRKDRRLVACSSRPTRR